MTSGDHTLALPTRLLSVRKAAEYAVVSESTIRRWLKEGLPFFRARRQIRIDQADLVKFLRAGGSSGHCENPSKLQSGNKHPRFSQISGRE